jgi:hypothetical protein
MSAGKSRAGLHRQAEALPSMALREAHGFQTALWHVKIARYGKALLRFYRFQSL